MSLLDGYAEARIALGEAKADEPSGESMSLLNGYAEARTALGEARGRPVLASRLPLPALDSRGGNADI